MTSCQFNSICKDLISKSGQSTGIRVMTLLYHLARTNSAHNRFYSLSRPDITSLGSDLWYHQQIEPFLPPLPQKSVSTVACVLLCFRDVITGKNDQGKKSMEKKMLLWAHSSYSMLHTTCLRLQLLGIDLLVCVVNWPSYGMELLT